MCDPVSIAATMAVVGTGVTAYGQIQEGKAQSAAAQYNSRLANVQAENEKQRGLEAEAAHARKVTQLKASQRAGMAANGLDLTSDTAMSIFEQTAEWGERDRQTIAHNTDMNVWGLKSGASLYSAQGKNAKTASYYGAGSTLLNGSANTLFNLSKTASKRED